MLSAVKGDNKMKHDELSKMWEYVAWHDVGHGTHIIMHDDIGEFIIDTLIPKKWYDRFFGIGQIRIDKAIEKMLLRGKFKITI